MLSRCAILAGLVLVLAIQPGCSSGKQYAEAPPDAEAPPPPPPDTAPPPPDGPTKSEPPRDLPPTGSADDAPPSWPPETTPNEQPRPTPVVPPPSQPPPPEEADLQSVDNLIAGLPIGHIAFNVPPTMKRGDHREIQLVLSMLKSIDEVKAEVQAEGERIGAEVKIANRMVAVLNAPEFSVDPEGEQEQLISLQNDTQWNWDISSDQPGAHTLRLTLYALVDVDGKSSRYKVESFNKDITVRVTGPQRIGGFVQGNWQWLWAAILFPVGGWFLQQRKTRKRQREID